MTTQEAVKHLTEQLDLDQGYRYSWQANIAVQFQDSWQRAVEQGGLPCTKEQVHTISNDAAKNFLSVLCGTKEKI